MEALSDEELVERYRAEPDSRRGNPYIDQLFQRHHTKVAAWCFRMTGDVDSAADLAQEVFLKAFQRLASFRGDSKFTTWLYVIARNRCLDELRTKAVRPEDVTDAVMEEMADLGSEDISSAMERRESEEMVRLLIRESLDKTESEVMTLHYVHELPLDSVTRILGLANPSGAKQYIVSARRKLSRAFARWNKQKQGAKGGSHAE
jgi:RNA polymerase sigma-70 factor (ECF subfamily)